jgi:hypothetical protein
MTLNDAFKKYNDDVLMKRTSSLFDYGYPIRWLKDLKMWGNIEARKLGFFIPDIMIETADATDWELYDKSK